MLMLTILPILTQCTTVYHMFDSNSKLTLDKDVLMLFMLVNEIITAATFIYILTMLQCPCGLTHIVNEFKPIRG